MKGLQIKSRSPFLTLFLSGFAAGVLYIVLFGRAAVHETTLMSTYFFSRYQQIEFASEELSCLYSEIASLGIYGNLACRSDGCRDCGGICRPYLAWGLPWHYRHDGGDEDGSFWNFVVCGQRPSHFVLYVPACSWLLRRVCLMSSGREWRTRSVLYQYLAVWLIGLILFTVGAWLESYVNPAFLKTVLRKL